MAMNTDACVDLSRSVINTTFDDLTDIGIEMTKMDILDTLGTLLGGSTADAGAEVVELAKNWGGKAESTIMAYGGKVPAPMAAFCNATMAHALDLDDTHSELPVHVGPIVVSAALATAEMLGGVSGKDFITAVALGGEVQCRLARACKYPIHKHGFMFTPLYGYFGATMAAAKLLNLNEEQMINAFGIAYAQCSGNVQVNIDDEHALTKRMSCGFASRGGIMAALLAQKNLTGAQHSLEGTYGLFKIYQHNDYNREELIKELGKKFEIDLLSFKPWASCRQTHAFIDAALQLKHKYNIDEKEIDHVTVFINELAGKALCDPLDLRRNPEEEVHAQFSIPWTVGVALTYGKVAINSIKKENLTDPRVREVTAKISYEIDPSLADQKLLAPEKAVQVTMKDGTVYTSTGTSIVKGDPKNPMSREEMASKFLDCAELAPEKIDDAKLQKVIDICCNLENVEDVSVIPALLA